jgi:hypothetical protein
LGRGIAAYCKPENTVALGFVEGMNNKISWFVHGNPSIIWTASTGRVQKTEAICYFSVQRLVDASWRFLKSSQ